MNDAVFSLLLSELNRLPEESRALWVVDENITPQQIQQCTASHVAALTNRYTVAQQLKASGFAVELSDFDFSQWPSNYFDTIVYRVSKEKPVVHHIINAADDALKPGGKLVLCGYKNEGTKTYIEKAEKLLGEKKAFERGKNSAMLAVLSCLKLDNRKLDDKNYRETIPLDTQGLKIVSKPGVYGWNKIDKGSEFLVEQLPAVLNSMPTPNHIADLGCGYGYLSLMASQLVKARFYASDNNVAAVNLCRENFAGNGVVGEFFLDDAGISISVPIDLVLCNPPFHQGFDTDNDLNQHFLRSAKRLLSAGGSALFVVNSFIAVEKKSKGIFSSADVVANNGSFKVCLLQ